MGFHKHDYTVQRLARETPTGMSGTWIPPRWALLE